VPFGEDATLESVDAGRQPGKEAQSSVESQGGRVDNYMGDGLLAVFGINAETDSALGAVRAGLEVLDCCGHE
jgi:class 3 adenylate cyclase